MKRLLSLVLAVVMVLSTASVAYAAVIPPDEVQYSHVNSLYACLSIDKWGVTTCTGRVSAKSVRPVEVDVYLQQYTGSYWRTVASWSASGSWQASLTRNYAVYSGYQYRVLAIGYVYDDAGNILESVSGTHTVNYP